MYKFTKTPDPDNKFEVSDVTFNIDKTNVTLPELRKEFERFVQACGYDIDVEYSDHECDCAKGSKKTNDNLAQTYKKVVDLLTEHAPQNNIRVDLKNDSYDDGNEKTPIG